MPDNPTSAPDTGSHIHWGSILRNVTLGLVIIIGIWMVFNVRLPSLGTLQDDIAQAGAWGFAIFVGLYIVVAATPIPITIVSLAGGMAFGLLPGTALSLIGVILGSWSGYWIARALGRKTVLKLLGNHAATIEARLTDGGFYAVCGLRLLPGFPYWPVNYGSGALGINNRTFLTATAIASVPSQLSLVAVGAFIGHHSVLNAVVVAISWLVVLTSTLR